MAASGVTPISNRQELFRLCGFNDRDGNGVIVKKGITRLQIRNEGYNEDADIAGDGYITESEAKLYLLTMKNIRREDLMKFRLTNEDEVTLASDFKKRLGRVRNLKTTYTLAFGCPNLIKTDDCFLFVTSRLGYCKIDKPALRGIFGDMFDTAKRWGDEFRNSKAISDAGVLIGRNFNVDEALAIAKGSGFEDLILEGAVEGMIKDMRIKDALRCARKIHDPDRRYNAISKTAAAAKDLNIFVEAMRAARESGNHFDVVMKMTKCGFVEEARKFARTIDYASSRLDALNFTYEGTISRIQKLTKVGRPEEALDEIRKIEDPDIKINALLWFAENMEDTPSNKELKIASYREALDACPAVTGKVSRDNIYCFDYDQKDHVISGPQYYFEEDHNNYSVKRVMLNKILGSIRESKIGKRSSAALLSSVPAIISSIGVNEKEKIASDRYLALTCFVETIGSLHLARDLSRDLFRQAIRIGSGLAEYQYMEGRIKYDSHLILVGFIPIPISDDRTVYDHYRPCSEYAKYQIESSMLECGFSEKEIVGLFKETGWK